MKANSAGHVRSFDYTLHFWGEIVRGTKDELQNLGIAVGMTFPAEPDGPKRKLNVRDPRGFETRIERWYGDGMFAAHIHYPGRGRRQQEWSDFAAGVRVSSDCAAFDEYEGTAGALVDAGLVRLDQLPGQPGARKVSVTVWADGTAPKGHTKANDPRNREPGAMCITRPRKNTYRVCVFVTEADEALRREASSRADLEHEARMLALPRPAPLTARRAISFSDQWSVLDRVRDEACFLAAFRAMDDGARRCALGYAKQMVIRCPRFESPALRVIPGASSAMPKSIPERPAPCLHLVSGGAS